MPCWRMQRGLAFFWKKWRIFSGIMCGKWKTMPCFFEEVEAVDNYIYILNVRFAGDIHYEKDVDEGIGDFRIPSMILQPLVENAVQHGIHDCMETGKIKMSIHKAGEDLEITVSDNGAGMTPEMIQSVMAGRARNNGEDRYSTGIAVGNVIDRLELYYKQKGFLS